MENKIITKLPVNERGIIDYKSMVGMDIDLIYKDELYTVKIIKYYKDHRFDPRFLIDYNGYVYEDGISVRGFCQKYKFGKILKMRTNEFKKEIGENVNGLIITDREYRIDKKGQNCKYYKYTCTKCGWTEGWIIEGNLTKGNGCSCCCNPPQVVVPHINSIWAKAPWMMKWISEEDAKGNLPQSNDEITVRCPDCGKEKKIKIAKLYNRKSIGCSCGDGFSYPSKFISNMLKQLNIEFEVEYSPDYLVRMENNKKSRKYSDFYLPEYNLVIEADGGMGHEGGKTHGYSKKTLEECIEIDKWKDEQHKLHEIDTVRIDCRESNLEYIKENILKSKLANVFDLSQINWLKCEEFALSNLVKKVCDYWNNNDTSILEVAEIFGLSKTTIRTYVKFGVKHGWCEYDIHYQRKKGGMKAARKTSKPVLVYKDGAIIERFNSLSELERESLERIGEKLFSKCVSRVLKGIAKEYKGYTFSLE